MRRRRFVRRDGMRRMLRVMERKQPEIIFTVLVMLLFFATGMALHPL